MTFNYLLLELKSRINNSLKYPINYFKMYKPLTKKELSKKYMVSYNTFIKWLKNVPELKLYANQRTLTPKQIEIIYNELGQP